MMLPLFPTLWPWVDSVNNLVLSVLWIWGVVWINQDLAARMKEELK
jgi:hypothetical protein